METMISTEYRCQLDKSSKKFHCPQCGKKRYVRFMNSEGQYIDYQYGRCDREVSCGYFLKPEVRTSGVPYYPQTTHNTQYPQSPHNLQITHIPSKHLKVTLTAYDTNPFVKYLVTLFGEEIARNLVQEFYIGTAKNGGTVFWQIDEKKHIRHCKVMKYNAETGRRKKGQWDTKFLGKKLVGEDANLQQCLFGLHRIDSKTIAIVESEKTAILATVYLPQYTWMATGGKHGARIEHQLGLKGKKVVLFPDAGCYDQWQKKAEDIRLLGCDVAVSEYLELIASEKEQGYDLADYLVTQDDRFKWALTENDYPVMWDGLN